MRGRVLRIALAGLVAACTAVPAAAPGQEGASATFDDGEIGANHSIAAGQPWDGALIFGVQLPTQGEDFFTWDFPLRHSPNRPWRRWTADGTLAILLEVIHEYRLAHPEAPRVGIADLSRHYGGPFGRRFGGLGHASHQNGLDADVLYPRLDGRERWAKHPDQIDLALSRDLLRRFVRAGAQFVFVGPHTGLSGPPKIVQTLVNHDDHMHVRLPKSLGAPG